ncbi:MAG: ABC transporter substrate-binding protein [Campylobacterota bacterium]|nr:ABC transporter substrate-binding protein [Campylobacterota bacterium]
MVKSSSRYIIFCILLTNFLCATQLQKVSLQLQWLNQFQFAGYYMAKHKGFYELAGLDVELKPFKNGINVAQEVNENRATYGIGRSSLIIEKSKGANIKLLSAIFQSSPLVVLSTKNSNIRSVKDFRGKKIMTTSDATSTVSIEAMINQNGVDLDDLIKQQHSFDINDLISKKTDLMVAYISNEPFLLKKQGVKPVVFDPKDYGFDFYSDLLFTSDNEIKNHKQRALDFRDASLMGWEYAFEHIDETINLIFEKYNEQKKSKEALLHEAMELKELVYLGIKDIGNIDGAKIKRIYDIYNVMGLIQNKLNLKSFVVDIQKRDMLDLTFKEKRYLNNKKELSVCVKKAWLPYEDMQKGKFIGIGADLLNLYAKKLDLRLKIVSANTQTEILKLLRNKKCDVKPMMGIEQEKKMPYISTYKQIEDNIVLITRIEQPFIDDLGSLKQTVVMAQGFERFIKFIQKEYVHLDIKIVKDIDTALSLVARGEVYGYIGTSLVSAYQIQKKYSTKLKIVNDFKSIALGIGVRDDDPMLLNILNKIMVRSTQKEIKEIFDKWIVTTVEKEQDYTFVWQLIGIFIFILSIVTFFLIRQKQLHLDIEDLNHALEEKVHSTVLDLSRAQKLAKVGSWRFCNRQNELSWSDEAYNIFGIDTSKYTIKTIEDFIQYIHPDDLEMVSSAFDNHIRTKEPYFKIHRIITPANQIKYVEERCESIFNDAGEALVSNGTVQDVTQRVLAQKDIESKNQQLIKQSQLAQMGEMISMIAHQWRQPLSAISARTNNLTMKIIMDQKVDTKLFHKELDYISEYAQHLSETIDDFRGFFKQNKQKELTTLEEIINSTLTIVQISLENKNIKIEKRLNCNITFETYASEIKQVVLNIIKNAEDVLLERKIQNPRIVIETCYNEQTQHKKIIIQDNAGGVPIGITDKIYEPYFSTKKEKDGTGLGMYMSKMIIEDHCDGKLSVINDEMGAVFSIELN